MKKKKVCLCDGMSFPHRRGCKKCNHREEFVINAVLTCNENYLRHTRNKSESEIFGENKNG
jgi:hypothetical protein